MKNIFKHIRIFNNFLSHGFHPKHFSKHKSTLQNFSPGNVKYTIPVTVRKGHKQISNTLLLKRCNKHRLLWRQTNF